MNQLERLIREAHRRSLWQVTGAYVLGSWGTLVAVGGLVAAAGLPEALPGLARILLIVGFPVVVVTAFVQKGFGGKGKDARETGEGSVTDATSVGGSTQGAASGAVASASPTNLAAGTGSLDRRRTGPDKWQRSFTWRNAVIGGVCAAALWGVLAASAFLLQRWVEAPAEGASNVGFAAEVAAETLVRSAVSPGERLP